LGEDFFTDLRSKTLFNHWRGLDQTLNSLAARSIARLEQLLKRWLSETHQSASPLYHHYIEGMIAEFATLRHQWQAAGCSDLTILCKLLPRALDFLKGVIQLTLDRWLRATNVLFYSVEQLLRLSRPIGSWLVLQDASVFMILTLRGMRHLTGRTHHRYAPVMLRLSPEAIVTDWDNSSELLFGFRAHEIVGQQALGTFVPFVETGGRTLSELLLQVCTAPHYYSFNLNENQDRQGRRLWVLWVNVPQYNANQELIEVLSWGIHTEEPELLRPLVEGWQSWRQLKARG
jgi:hypothetical protein